MVDSYDSHKPPKEDPGTAYCGLTAKRAEAENTKLRAEGGSMKCPFDGGRIVRRGWWQYCIRCWRRL